MITIENVSKSFENGVHALENVSLNVPSGAIFGIIGSNGSGKSTLLRILLGIYRPNKGKALYDGAPIYENPAVKTNFFYLSDDLFAPQGACMLDLIKLYRNFYPHIDKEYAIEMARRLNLNVKRSLRTFSKGMQRQAHIILALSTHPRVFVCDETFDGLDPVMRQAIKGIIADAVAGEGLTVILSGHNLREMEDICDHVAFLHQGKLLFQRSLWDLEEGFTKVQAAFNEEKGKEAFAALNPIAFQQTGRMVSFATRHAKDEVMSQIQAMQPVYIETLPLSLEEIFITEMEVHGYDPKAFSNA